LYDAYTPGAPDTSTPGCESYARGTRVATSATRPRHPRRTRAHPLGCSAAGEDDLSVAAPYTNGTPVANLELTAQLVAAPEPPKVIYVTNIGGYDTHQGQTARQQALDADLDTGLERFFTSVTAAGVADNVIVVTLSEFGRR
jgi:hypothetical protein